MTEKLSVGVSQRPLLEMVSEIVSAYLRHNTLPAGRVSELIHSVYKSLSEIDKGMVNSEEPTLKPAVPIRRSITPDHVVCLEDGKKLKMLKRHLRSTYDMSPDEYRSKWNLPSDYPMVAPNYAARRSEFAKKSGLGLKPKASQG
jgi:predicted transcriptional regulator